MVPKETGDMKVIITSKIGAPVMSVILKDVVHAPKVQFNLLSVTKLMIEGCTLSGDKIKISVSKGAAVMSFEVIMKTPKGQLFCATAQRFSEVVHAMMELSKSNAHKLLGYSNNASAINTAKSLG